jgi:hypothetical protein
MKLALRIVTLSAVLTGTVFSIGMLSGCRTHCRRAATADYMVCPACKMQTETRPIKTCSCEKGLCPSCKKVTPFTPQQEEIVRNYVGISSDIQTIHVCTHCKAVVEKCPECRKQAEVVK